MTHNELVARAVHWLRGRARCVVAAAEVWNPGIEIPDAIGFTYRASYLIECKTSRGDFFRDIKFKRRQFLVGLGNYRYYMTPVGLIRPEEIPERWGLLECRPTQVRIVKEATWIEMDKVIQKERNVLISLLKRMANELAEKEGE